MIDNNMIFMICQEGLKLLFFNLKTILLNGTILVLLLR
jgi:hypothetical protein